MPDLTLRIEPAVGDEKQLTCFVCGYPRDDGGRMRGPEVEYTVTVFAAGDGWAWGQRLRGLHERCREHTEGLQVRLRLREGETV